MKGSQILKEFFLIQNPEEQLRIIKDYNIKIDGFNNINKVILKNFKPKICESLVNKRNYNKIIKKNIENSKRFNYKMDIYLDSNKIIEKHGKKWDELLQIMLKDNFEELSLSIIEELKKEEVGERKDENLKTQDNTTTPSKKYNELREIIKKLEKDNKLFRNEHIRLKRELSNLNEKYHLNQEALRKKNDLNDEIKKEQNKLNDEIMKYKMRMKEKEEENENLLDKVHKLKERNTKLENLISTITIHIIGFDKKVLNECEYTVIPYSLQEVDKFIEQSKRHKKDIFYAYKFGVPTSMLFKLKKHENIDIKSNLSKLRGGV